ncbi:hypothetical protein ACQKJG_18265 [Priestia megaterium]|uniref:hypothetical protein n=1 Tax=Priestia megaterium TaxID=1404 RepID=UPI003D08E507
MKTEILFHTVEYWYEMHPNMELPESEEEYIKYMINQGYREGELNYYDSENEKTYYGWWKINHE